MQFVTHQKVRNKMPIEDFYHMTEEEYEEYVNSISPLIALFPVENETDTSESEE